uniref:Uncharacterized protein n=1 Tax=Salix viminalis TaxID=40686 RepID=A0A6N2KGM3_SALVM
MEAFQSLVALLRTASLLWIILNKGLRKSLWQRIFMAMSGSFDISTGVSRGGICSLLDGVRLSIRKNLYLGMPCSFSGVRMGN